MNKAELIAAINKADADLKVDDKLTVVQLEAIHKGLTSGETIEQLTASLEETTSKVASLEKATGGDVITFDFDKKSYQVLGGGKFVDKHGVLKAYSPKQIASNKTIHSMLVEKGSGLVKELS